MSDLVVLEGTVGAVGSYIEVSIQLEELGGDPVIVETYPAEIPQDGLVGDFLHGKVMMRALPEANLPLVALGANVAPYVLGF
jgi:hypothetical protein